MELGKHALAIALNVGVALVIFSYALRASPEDLRFLARERRLMGLSLVSIFIVTPALAVAVVEWISMPGSARLAIVALSFSIIPPTLPRRQFAAGGHRPYANVLMLVVALVAIPIVPLLVDLSGKASNHPYGVPAGEIAGYVATVLAAPLLVGLVIRWRWRRSAERMGERLERIAFLLTTVAIAVVVLSSLPAIWHLIGTGTILGMALFTVGAMGIGHLMGGPDRSDELVLALSSATRHPAIAITVATVNYPEGRVSSAVVLCLIVNAIIAAFYTRFQKGRLAAGIPDPAG